jgi:hypothetical protein
MAVAQPLVWSSRLDMGRGYLVLQVYCWAQGKQLCIFSNIIIDAIWKYARNKIRAYPSRPTVTWITQEHR